MYPINADTAHTFLRAIAPASDRFIFQTYSDCLAPDSKSDPLLRTPAGTLQATLPALQAVTDQGAAVCVQINDGVRRGRGAITAVRAVFADIDSVESASLRDIAHMLPRPTAIVMSSPGKYHVYWRVLDCALEHFRLLQLRLAKVCRSDPKVANLDRVMRLPGTWHFKSATPYQVQLLAHSDCYYSAAVIAGCIAPDSAAITVPPGKSTHKRKSVTDALIVAAEKFELPERLAKGERVNLLIRYSGSLAGRGYSADAIRAELQRANIQYCDPPLTDAEMIASIYPSAQRFTAAAAQETTRAVLPPESTPDDPFDMSTTTMVQRATMDEFLRRYILIEHGSEVADLECPQPHLSVMSINDWKNATANKRVGDYPLSMHWLMSPHRKSVIGKVYYPRLDRIFEDSGMRYYNTYSPATISPADVYDSARAGVFWDHIDYLFSGDAPAIIVFTNWLATTVQLPHERIPWAPLIVSSPGVGKGWFYQLMQVLLGAHNCAMIRSDDLGDKASIHNEWLSGTLLVCIDEMDSGSKWSDMNRLKGIMTEPYQIVNKKYGAKNKERIFANFLCFSNTLDAAAIRDDDRRFWVHQVPHKASPVPGYYTRLFAWLTTDGPAHLLRWCLNHDLSKFDFAAPPPMTIAKSRMIRETMPIFEKLLRDAIEDGVGCFRADVVSTEQIKSYALAVTGEDKLHGNMVHILRSAVARATYHLPQDRYTVVLHGKASRVYLRGIRNESHWSVADTDAIVAEYLRSRDAEASRLSATISRIK